MECAINGGRADGEAEGGLPMPGEQEVLPGEGSPKERREIDSEYDEMSEAAAEEVRGRALEQRAAAAVLQFALGSSSAIQLDIRSQR